MKPQINTIFSTGVTLAFLGSLFLCASVVAQCPIDWIKTDGFPGVDTFKNVEAVVSWDPDGNGPQAAWLVIGGDFDYAGDRVANRVAALNPATGKWEDLAGGVHWFTEYEGQVFDEGVVHSLGVYQNDLIVAGAFNQAGGLDVNSIARWDGAQWSPMGNGPAGIVSSMTEYNGELIATGMFFAPGVLMKWDGTSWFAFGGGPVFNGIVARVLEHNGDLIAVGNFTTAGGVPANRIARWDGSQWHALGSGLDALGFALTILDGDLYVGGNFQAAGGVPNARGVARWDGANWHAVGPATFAGVGWLVAYHGDLIAAGDFIANVVGGQTRYIARFDSASQQWTSMEGGFNGGGWPTDMVVHNDEVIVGGAMRKAGPRAVNALARWAHATQSWERVGSGFNITPYRFTTYRGELVAGGSFESAGDSDARGVARWDGSAWHALEGGGITGITHIVNALEVYDDELIIAGSFTSVGGVPAENIAAYSADTGTWRALGSGIAPGGTAIVIVNALAVYNGELIAGGQFGEAGGVPASYIARWNGSQWQPLGGGVAGIVNALAVYNGELIVTGSFLYAGGGTNLVANGLARWNGSIWQAFPPGGQNGFAMTVYNGQLICGVQQPRAWNGSTWTLLPGWSWDPNGEGLQIMGYAVLKGELIIGGIFNNAAGIREADHLVRFNGMTGQWSAFPATNGTIASGTSGVWAHNGELITNGRLVHPDGTVSNWRRRGSACAPADINSDGIVNVSDLLAVINAWGACPTPPQSCPADIAPPPNGDGQVNVSDLLTVINNWG